MSKKKFNIYHAPICEGCKRFKKCVRKDGWIDTMYDKENKVWVCKEEFLRRERKGSLDDEN